MNKETMVFHLSFPEILTAIISVISLLFIFRILNQWAKLDKKLNPPQPKGSWPLIGHLHLLGGSELPHKVLGNLADRYGPIFMMKLGVHQALVVSSSELAKECFTTNDKAFASRSKALVPEMMTYNYASFGFSPYGDYWRKVRKMVNVELLSQRRVEMLGYIRVPEVRASMKDVFEAWVKSKENTDSDMVLVEMKEWFGHLTLNMVVKTILGKRFSPNDEEAVQVKAMVRKLFELLGTFLVSDFIPYAKFLDFGGYEKSMKIEATNMDKILQGWLDERKRQRVYGCQSEDKQVFMDVLISVLEDDSKEEFLGFDRDTIIKSTSLAMLAGGKDTTSVTLTWALSLLLNNPEALKTAQDEIDFHVGKERLIEESDIKNLVYLQAIIKETLRLYPAAPLSIPHEAIEDCIVGGYNIRKGTRLITNIWKIHHDPNIWSDPKEFRPERFLTSQKDIDVKGQHYELLPFGSGRRMCPGVSFALHSLHLTLASLMQGFELVKPSNEPIDMSVSLEISNMKATPLEVLLSPRLSSNMYHDGA